jgi:hypothetical protein
LLVNKKVLIKKKAVKIADIGRAGNTVSCLNQCRIFTVPFLKLFMKIFL